jgi:hypothetical protein
MNKEHYANNNNTHNDTGLFAGDGGGAAQRVRAPPAVQRRVSQRRAVRGAGRCNEALLCEARRRPVDCARLEALYRPSRRHLRIQTGCETVVITTRVTKRRQPFKGGLRC